MRDPTIILSLIFRYYLIKMMYLNFHFLMLNQKNEVKNGVQTLLLFDKKTEYHNFHFLMLNQKTEYKTEYSHSILHLTLQVLSKYTIPIRRNSANRISAISFYLQIDEKLIICPMKMQLKKMCKLFQFSLATIFRIEGALLSKAG